MDQMSAPRPIPRQSLHDQLVEQLRTLVTEGAVAPGEKLNELALAAAFGVSRTPLREALKVLASEGLVTLNQNRGARVARVSAKDLREVFPVLMALEGLAGRMACTQMPDAAIADVARLQRQMEDEYARGDLSAYFRFNQMIHEAILEGSANEILISTHRALSGRVRRARFMANMSAARWARAIAEHQDILAALSARDGPRLSALLESHLGNKLQSLLQDLPPEMEIGD